MTGLLTPAQAAKALTIKPRTLREHVKDGTITYVITGRGKKRPRIAFAQSDLDAFEEDRRRRNLPIVETREPSCPSTGRAKAHSIITTSGSTVVAFSDLQKRRAGATPKP